MSTLSLQHKLLLTTATVMGALSGYSRGAYAQQVCLQQGSTTTFLCDGPSANTQDLTFATTGVNNANVITGLNFDVATGNNIAVNIAADGDLSYTDLYASPLRAAVTGLYISANSGAVGTPGSITVNTNGPITSSPTGIETRNSSSGATNITVNGSITGGNVSGIVALNGAEGNAAGSDLTVTTAAGATVSAAAEGIRASNFGSGATTVTANGDTNGTNGQGIFVAAGTGTTQVGTDVTLTTAAGTTHTGLNYGLLVRSFASGSTTVTADGDSISSQGDGIAARNGNVNYSTGTNLAVIAAGYTYGGDIGISAFNYGSGTTAVTNDGDVIGRDEEGILSRLGTDAGDFTATTGAGTTVDGGTYGVSVDHRGTGALNITANGDSVTGNANHGIYSIHRGDGDTNITTSASTTIMGGESGIVARLQNFLQIREGNINVVANGDVTGTANDGISALNEGNGNISITTGAGAAVEGADNGISARHEGDGEINVTAIGDVSGGVYGIFGLHEGAGDLNVTTTANATVTGGTGIYASHSGAGAFNISLRGDVIGTDEHGIYASRTGGGSIDITVNTGTAVTSNGVGADDFAVQTANGPTNLIVAGTLNGGSGGALAFDQDNATDDRLELRTTGVVNGNAFAGDGTDTLAFAGTGNGTFNLDDIDTGTDTQQYRAFETFVVESATWTMNGVTSADFIVEGGTLKGNGTFGDLTVNGGTLSPGNSFGTMTVNGAFSLNAGSIFEVEVNANNQGDLVVVNGTVNLTGATLRILAAPGDYELETDYVIIDNDSTDPVQGTFGTITSTLAFLIPTVALDGGTGNDVVLTLTRNEVDPCDVADTDNQDATCDAIDEDNPLFDEILRQTAAGARQAFDALSGEIHASAAGVIVDDNRYVREAILTRLMQANHTGGALSAGGPQVASLNSQAMALGYDGKSLVEVPRAPLAFWTGAYGAWGTYDGDGNAATAKRDLGGFMSGMDAGIGGSWRAGLTTGASYSSIDVDARFSAADVESYYLGGYLGGMAGSFAFRGGGTWAWSGIDTSRAVVFPGFFERQKASYDANTGQLFGEVAYPTQMGGIAVAPFGGIAYVSLDTDRFRERGGPLASLRGLNTDQDVGYTTLGLRAATTMQWGSTVVTPHISARWQHAFDDVTPSAALAFATTGAVFTVEGVPLAEDSALLDAGLDFAVSDRISAGVSYTGQFADNVIDNGVKGRFTWLF